MGIVILPFLTGAIIIGVIAIFKSISLIDSKDIGIKEIIYGLLISIILYLLIGLVYLIQGKAWGLSPFFRLPLIMIFIPYLIYIGTKENKSPKEQYFSKILLVSIGITSLFGTIFHELFFGIMHYLGIQKTY